MPVPPLTFSLSLVGYAVVPRAALGGHGRRLSRDEAQRVLSRALADPTQATKLRRVYAALSHQLDISRVSNEAVLVRLTAWVGREDGPWSLVTLDPGARREEPAQDPETRSIDERLQKLGRAHVLHHGHAHRVVRAEEAARLPDRSRYEALSPREARAVLEAAAVDAARPEAQRNALAELIAAIERLVVLRQLRSAPIAAAEKPVMTASQYREARQANWLEIVLEDDRLGPLSGQSFELTPPGGQRQTSKTDAAGRFRLERIEAGACEVRFRSVAGHVPQRSDVAWDRLEQGISLATNEVHTLTVVHNEAHVIALDGPLFYAGTSVPLPVAAEFGAQRATWGHHTLSILTQALRFAEAESGRKLLIVGHAAPFEGDVDALSAARARAVLALLEGDAKTFGAAMLDPAGDATPQLLRWASERHGYDCDPDEPPPQSERESGGETEQPVDIVQQALVRFRAAYNAQDDGALDEAAAGMVTADYEAMFTLYERSLAVDLGGTPASLDEARKRVQFHTTKEWGAGARWGGTSRVDLMFFEGDRPVPAMDATVVPFEHLHVDARRVRRVSLPPELPPPVICLRMTGLYFDANKSFLLPGALAGMRKLVKMYREHPVGELLVVGHADKSGDPAYNDALSLERAKAMAAYLADDVDGWLAWYDDGVAEKKRWGKVEDSLMLGALPDAREHQGARQPIQSYQASRGLKADGIAGPKTRKQLVTDYMALDGTSLPAGIKTVAHGCGEHFPRFQTPDGKTEPRNRRVELFMFDGGIMPAPGSENSKQGSAEYGQWRSRVVRHLKLDRAGPDFVVVLRVHYDVDGHDATVLRLVAESGTTTKRAVGEPIVTHDGERSLRMVRFEAVPPGTYKLMATADRVSYCVMRDIVVDAESVTVGGELAQDSESEEPVEGISLAAREEDHADDHAHC